MLAHRLSLLNPFGYLLLTGTALFATGCGPAVIATAIGSGGGGGGTDPVSSPVIRPQEMAQPAPDQTLIVFDVAQAEGRSVRLRLEFDNGAASQPIPLTNLVPIADPVALTPAPSLQTDGGGNYLLPANGGGIQYRLLWNHRAQFGVVEPVGVQVVAVADLGGATPLVTMTANSTPVIERRTLGRKLSDLSALTFERIDAQNADSAFRVRATLTDEGADVDITLFDIEYALTQQAATPGDWVRVPEMSPQVIDSRVLADGRREYDVRVDLDPFTLGWPRGQFEQVAVRVRHREDYPPARRGLTPPSLPSPEVIAIVSPTDIGFKPSILVSNIADPGNPNSEEFRRVFPRLAIPVRVRNPSAQRPMRVRLRGEYSLSDFGAAPPRPMTLFASSLPEGATEFDLAAGQTVKHFLVWNVIADEGLGCDPTGTTINNPRKIATVWVLAESVSPTPLPATARPLVSAPQQAPNLTHLSTLPFVDFRANLLVTAGEVYSAGQETTAATRDLFFTITPSALPAPPGGPGAEEYLVGVNQQFEPIQISPAPPLFNTRLEGPSPGSGISELIPTDFAGPQAGLPRPDCIYWRGADFYTAVWPTNGGAPQVNQIGTAPGTTPLNEPRGSLAESFVLNDATGSTFVAVFFRHTQPTVVPQQLVLRLIVLSRRRDLAGSFVGPWLVTPREAIFELPATLAGAAVPVNPEAVVGEFDGNPATKEIAFANIGAEFAVPGRPGLLDMFAIGLDAASQLTITGPFALPSPTIASTARQVEEFRLLPWRSPSGGGQGLAYLRQTNDLGPPQSRQYDVHILSNPGNLANGAWSFETRIDSNPNTPGIGGYDINGSSQRIVAAHSRDLDEGANGIPGSDLLIVTSRNRGQVGVDSSKQVAVLLYANRSGGRTEWRRVLNNISAQLPDGQLLPGGAGRIERSELADVNGDRFLDLLTGEVDNRLLGPVAERPRFWNYFSSSLAGVAGGLRSLPVAGVDVGSSRLPGTLDANLDGQLDLIANDRLYLGSATGVYTLTGATGFFSSGPTYYHRAEKIYADLPGNAIDVLVYDGVSSDSRIVRVTGFAPVPQPTLGVVAQTQTVGFGSPLLFALPLVAPDSAMRLAKDIVGLTAPVGTGTAGQVLRRRLEGSTWTNVPVAGGFTALASAGLCVVRRASLTGASPAQRNDLVQDFVVVNNSDQNKLIVFESHNGYQPRQIALPAGEQALRVAAGSTTADSLEDVMVMTRSGSGAGLWRLRAVRQDANTQIGLGGGAPSVEFLRFEAPYGQSQLRAFAFDQTAFSFAEGFLLVDDDGAASLPRAECRFVRGIADPGGALGVRYTRSPIGTAVDSPLDTVVSDTDADGFSEVVGGQWGVGVRRVTRNQQ